MGSPGCHSCAQNTPQPQEKNSHTSKKSHTRINRPAYRLWPSGFAARNRRTTATAALLACAVGFAPHASAANSRDLRASAHTTSTGMSAKLLSFEKGAQQFCIADLSAEDQSRFYSKIVNIGASFSHGCMGCDSSPVWQGYTEMSDDQFWVRRNFLSHFLRVAPWKKPEEFKFEQIYVLENDPKTRPMALLRSSAARTDGYTGEWRYDPATGAFGLLSAEMRSELVRNDPELEAAGALVGGPMLQLEKNGRISVRTSGHNGVLMRTIPGRFAATGAQPKSVYDLAVDGGFLDLQFALFTEPAIIEALNKTGWRDPALREKAISALADRLAGFDAGLILGVDTLFWDTVFETLYHLREAGVHSPLVRLIFAVIQNLPIGQRIFDQERRENIRADFLEALTRVSRGHGGHKATPVLLARLANEPITKFKDKRYMPVLATIFGQFFQQVTGVDLMTDILRWLDRISFVELPAGAHEAKGASIPRSGGIQIDELGVSFSADDVRQLRKTFHMLYKESAQKSDDLYGNSISLARQPRTVRFAFDPVGGAEVTMFPKFTQGIVGRLLGAVLVELPGFVEELEEVFASVNKSVIELGSRTDNNVHILDVNEFFDNLGYFLNPRTAHPSVLGAERMARMVDRTICGRSLLASDGPSDLHTERGN